MDDSEFDAAGRVPEEALQLAEAFVFASPEPVTERTLAPLLPEGTNTYLMLEGRGSNQGNIQSGRSPSRQSSIDLRCYLEMALLNHAPEPTQ